MNELNHTPPDDHRDIETVSDLCGDPFVLQGNELAWGDERAYLFGTEVVAARAAIRSENLLTCRLIFSTARGSF